MDDLSSNNAPFIPPPNERPWGVGMALVAYLGFITVQIVPGVIAGVLYAWRSGISIDKLNMDGSNIPVPVWGIPSIISSILTALWVYFLIKDVHGLDFWRSVPWTGKKYMPAFKAALAGFITMGVNAVLSAWVFPTEGLDIPLEKYVETAEGLIYVGFIAIFLAPFAEELLFRGYMFAPLERKWGKSTAVAITTALFMTPHMTQLGEYWPGVFLIGLLGAVAGTLRAYTGSVRASYICHLVYNSFLVLLEALSRLPAFSEHMTRLQ